MRYAVICIMVVCLLGAPSTVLSSKIFTEIGPELRYMSGDSTYNISFAETWANGGHGESELEFPIDNMAVGIRLAIGSRYEKTHQIIGQFALTMLGIPSADAGTMKDSDWIENDGALGENLHSGKDMYTESDTEINGLIFDVNYAYHLRCAKSWTLGPMLGFRYQELEYEITGAKGTYWTTPVSVSGRALDYEVSYKIPYVGLSSGLLLGKKDQFQMNLTFAYSDWAKAEDRDDHVLRYKLSEGDCEGEAYLINLNANLNVSSNWVLGLGAEYVDIHTLGNQHQRYYAGPYAGASGDVDDKITAAYWSAILRISYRAF